VIKTFTTPVVFFIYKRLQTTVKVFDVIKTIKPYNLYLIADGPKSSNDIIQCNTVREYIENNIDWDCKFNKIYSTYNLGLAKRISSGLDQVFAVEESAIILEDDTLPDQSFFWFCDELLRHYSKNERISHISGCNPFKKVWKSDFSYDFCSIINIWGWATWKRAWMNFDLNMTKWANIDKKQFLNTWCHSTSQKKGVKKMFDLHCNNPDPWTWDYQWIFSCWNSNSLGIIPRINLVSNLGIGPDATNTKSNIIEPIYPRNIESISLPLNHPKLKRNLLLEKNYLKSTVPSLYRRIKINIKSFLKHLI